MLSEFPQIVDSGVLFWGVCDVLQLGLLSENDVPESIRWFVDSLGLN